MTSTTLPVEIYDITTSAGIDALVAHVSAGEPLEVTSEVERIDPTALLTRGSDACLLIRVHGESMVDLIKSGDWVVLDRAKEPHPGDVVLANLNGSFTLKRHKLNDRGLYLVPANALYDSIKVTERDSYEIVGVVINIIHPLL